MRHSLRTNAAARGLQLVLIVWSLIPATTRAGARTEPGDPVDREVAFALDLLTGAIPGLSPAARDAVAAELGLDALATRPRVAVYAETPIPPSRRELMAESGVEFLGDLWIPPVPGRHALGFHVARVASAGLDALRAEPAVRRVAWLERRARPELDLAVPLVRADLLHAGFGGAPPLDGASVALAIADSGVDFAHPDLPVPVEAFDLTDGDAPASWGTDVSNTVSPHGTHVTGIALGDGTASLGAYAGLAPAASLYFYKIGDDVTSNAAEADIVEALDRARAVGADVFSMSYSALTPFVDGSSPMCQAADAAVAAGVACFFAAGNAADDGTHKAVAAPPGQSSPAFGYTIDAPVAISAGGIFRAVWRDDQPGDLNVGLACDNLGPGESLEELTALAGTSPRGTETRVWILNVSLGAGQKKTYQLRATNLAVSGDTPIVHAFVPISVGAYDEPDPESTVLAPALADTALAVGSMSFRDSWQAASGLVFGTDETVGTVSTFSSRGPRIDGLQKPEFIAPGSAMIAARDAAFGNLPTQIIDDDGVPGGPAHYYVMEGTSMACPVAAGVAALLLQAFPDAPPEGLRAALGATAHPLDQTPEAAQGAGLIDAAAAHQFLADGGFALLYPGTPDDLRLLSGVDAEPTTGPTNDQKTASAGSLLLLRAESPQGTFVGLPFVLAALPVPTGSAIGEGPAGFYVGKPGVLLLVDGYQTGAPPVLIPGGNTFGYAIPAGLAGWSAVFQVALLSSAAANGVYATSEAHRVDFQ